MVATLAIPRLILHHLEQSQTRYYLSGIHTFMSFMITFHPDKELIYRFANKPSDVVLVPRIQVPSHIWGSLAASVTLCKAFDEVEERVSSPKHKVLCLSLSYASSTTNIYVLVIKQIEQVLG
jgi:hypothetical protein